MKTVRPDPVVAALVAIVIVGVLAAWWRVSWDATRPSPEAAYRLATVLGAGEADSGFARATGPRSFRFPRDHGAHPDYRSEWWYFTGNLRDENGRAYGFQLTLFRFALAAVAPQRVSEWATRQIWMGHFAVTDVATGTHRVAERFERGAAGLAGAETRPWRIWLDDWQVASVGEGDSLFPARLRATYGDTTLDLTLTAHKPLVLQGDSGYSAKSDAPGNASYYYSYTRLGAVGRLTLGGESHRLRGMAWLDREWSTSALADDQTGWDWFALQLKDGRDLMVYRLRRLGGGVDPASAGVIVGPGGRVTRFGADGFDLTPLRRWTSPGTGIRYPVQWRVRVPAAELDAVVEARVDDQEMNVGFRYWEGSVTVRGGSTRPAPSVTGVGYLEMTGYGRRSGVPSPR